MAMLPVVAFGITTEGSLTAELGLRFTDEKDRVTVRHCYPKAAHTVQPGTNTRLDGLCHSSLFEACTLSHSERI